MNRLTIIGNLTRDPELRTTTSGMSVCSFTVAVNRRKRVEGQPDADFFRVTAWKELAENCAKYLAKGRKVAVVGPVEVKTYTNASGKTFCNMEVNAAEVEFLGGAQSQHDSQQETPQTDAQTGYPTVFDQELPF